MSFLDHLRNFLKKPYVSMNRIEIVSKNILENFGYLQSLKPDASLFPVLKSNAYGHGLKQIVQILKKVSEFIPYVAVDSYPEYQYVRDYSDFHVLLLAETDPSNYPLFDFKRTTFCVGTLETLRTLISLNTEIKIHLFLDVGMHREGFDQAQLEEALQLLKSQKNFLVVEGVGAHLSHQDGIHPQFTQSLELYKKMFYSVMDHGHTPKYRHLGATAGIFSIKDAFFNTFRPGIGLYGYTPFSVGTEVGYEQSLKLKPALRVISRVVALREIDAGQGTGYDWMYVTDKKTKIGTLPFGYYEGLDRRLTGLSSLVWKDQILPVVGRISMNYSMFDAGENQVQYGDEIILISENPNHPNTVSAYAKSSATNTYQILTQLNSKIKKVVV